MVPIGLGLGRRRLLMATSAGAARTLCRIRALATVHPAIGVAATIGVPAMVGGASRRSLAVGDMPGTIRRLGTGARPAMLRSGGSLSRHLVALMRRSGLGPGRNGEGEGCRSSNEQRFHVMIS